MGYSVVIGRSGIAKPPYSPATNEKGSWFPGHKAKNQHLKLNLREINPTLQRK